MWMSIDTAPRDGTVILVSTPDGVTMAKWDMYWTPVLKALYIDGLLYDVTLSSSPTHWMPLP